MQYGTHLDADGNDEQCLCKVREVWADVSPLKGREYWEAKRINPETTYKITIRYFPDLTSDMLIAYGEKLLEIESIINVDEANVMLELTCMDHEKKSDE